MRVLLLTAVLTVQFTYAPYASAGDRPAISKTFRIPLVDLSQDADRHVIVAEGTPPEIRTSATAWARSSESCML